MEYSIKFNYRGSKKYERDFNINCVENGDISLDFDTLDSLKDHLKILIPKDPSEYKSLKINGETYITGRAIPSIAHNRLDFIIDIRSKNDEDVLDYLDLSNLNI